MREFFETLALLLIAAGSAILIVSPIVERFFRSAKSSRDEFRDLHRGTRDASPGQD